MGLLKRKSKSRLRGYPQERRGVATVEFAIVAPVLGILMLGALDVGQYVNVSHTVGNASREAARIAARSSTTNVATVQTVVSNYFHSSFPNVPSASLDAATQVKVQDGAGNLLTGDLSNLTPGESISVEVVCNFRSVRWLYTNSHLNDESLRTTTVMRRE